MPSISVACAGRGAFLGIACTGVYCRGRVGFSLDSPNRPGRSGACSTPRRWQLGTWRCTASVSRHNALLLSCELRRLRFSQRRSLAGACASTGLVLALQRGGFGAAAIPALVGRARILVRRTSGASGASCASCASGALLCSVGSILFNYMWYNTNDKDDPQSRTIRVTGLLRAMKSVMGRLGPSMWSP